MKRYGLVILLVAVAYGLSGCASLCLISCGDTYNCQECGSGHCR